MNEIGYNKMANYIHSSSIINTFSKIGTGCFIYPSVTIDKNVIIRPGVVINISSTICHDSRIGDCSFIGPNVTICGNVVIGENCFVGAGAIITNGIKVGNNVNIEQEHLCLKI